MDNKNDDFTLDEGWLDEVLGTGTPAQKPSPADDILSDSWATGKVPQTPKRKEPAKPEKKKKKKKDNGAGLFGIPHLLVTLIWLAIITVVGVSLGRTLWVCCADLMAFGKPDKAITITITDQEVRTAPDGSKIVKIEEIADKLEKAGLIEHPDLFTLFATLTGKDQDISVGTFNLNSYLTITL